MKQDTVLMLTTESNLVSEGLKFVMETNESNFMPYHNLSHLMNVAGWAYDITRHLYPQDYQKQYLMTICGLFHDFNHSGGKEKDDTANVEKAIEGFQLFYNIRTLSVPELSEVDFNFVKTIIKYTRFPHENILEKDKQYTEYINIIRDADLLQMTCDGFVPQVICGLAKEMGLSIKDMIAGQRKFVDSIKWNIPIVSDFFNNYSREIAQKLNARNNSNYNVILWRVNELEIMFNI